MWIVKAALKNPYAVIVFALMILVLGALAIWSIPVDILPAFKAPAVQVLTYFQGMPASSIEKTITNRIERWVNQSPGVLRIESKSVPGVSVVRLYFRDDIDPNGALTMTNSLALGTLPTLPPNTLPASHRNLARVLPAAMSASCLSICPRPCVWSTPITRPLR